MTEDINEIVEYLPLEYQSVSDSNYFRKLVESASRNLEAKDYHFTIVSLHMIYMGSVYQYLYRLHKASPTKFDSILIGFHNKLSLKKDETLSWHNFSKIQESSIFEFYRSVGLKPDKIGTLKKPVSERNDLLHTNGVYVDDESTFNRIMNNYPVCLKKIDDACKNEAIKLFNKFVRSITIKLQDKEEASQYLKTDFIREYSINLPTCNLIAKIPQSKYPRSRNNAKFISQALKEIIE